MSMQCQPIHDEVTVFEGLLRDINEEIRNTSNPREKSFLIRQRQSIIQGLQRKRKELTDCKAEESAPPNEPRGFVVLGEEVNQGLPNYQLVAGKDTLVRVFLGVKPPRVMPLTNMFDVEELSKPLFKAQPELMKQHLDLPSNTAKLDFADLLVTKPTGDTFVVAGDIGDGTFTNISKSYSEEDNANFYIGGQSLGMSGRYEFTARFYRNGIIIAERSLGKHVFQPTKDLRILIVVEVWPFPMDKISTLTNALEDLSRIFPIRAGVSELDGNLSAGLRYRYEPQPIDFDWPDRTPVVERLDRFNREQAAAGRPDRAEHALTIRTQQPGEMTLGGNAQSGPDGRIGGVVLNINPAHDGVFGTLISHEIGHNFISGDGHVQNLSIREPSAFDVQNRKTVSAPKALMFGTYSETPNGSGFLLPEEWQTIRAGLFARPRTGITI